MMVVENALISIEQRTVAWRGDELIAVLTEEEGQQVVYVPVRPLADFLGLSWRGQNQRIQRDPVLSSVTRLVPIALSRRGEQGGTQTQEMVCLPLKFINGWLFGINASRVRPELQEKVILYQQECYDVLAQAFQTRIVTTTDSSLAQIRDMALAIAQMAEQQMALEQRVDTAEARLNQAAAVVGGLQRRVTTLESRLSPGSSISDEQAVELSNRVKALADLLGRGDKSKNHYQGVFTELYRRFGVSSYKLVPQSKYASVMAFLDSWRENQFGEG